MTGGASLAPRSITETLSSMLGVSVTVTDWRPYLTGAKGYIVKDIPERAQAFSVARRVLNEFDGDPESALDMQVRVAKHCDDTWFVTVEFRR